MFLYFKNYLRTIYLHHDYVKYYKSFSKWWNVISYYVIIWGSLVNAFNIIAILEANSRELHKLRSLNAISMKHVENDKLKTIPPTHSDVSPSHFLPPCFHKSSTSFSLHAVILLFFPDIITVYLFLFFLKANTKEKKMANVIGKLNLL